LCQNLRWIWVQKWLWCIQISKIEILSFINETLREMCPIVNHVSTSFTKTNYFFVGQYYGQIHVFISFRKKNLTKIWYYYYYVVIWRKKVWIVPRRQFKFSSISRKWTIMGNMTLVVFFYNFSYLIIWTCSAIWN
jgi:hypothetical protein